jgi:hypothetical protein
MSMAFVVTWNGVHLGFVGQLLRRNFVAHGGNGKVARADEGNALVFAAFREMLRFQTRSRSLGEWLVRL